MSKNRLRPELVGLATFLRSELTARQWSLSDFNSKLGVDRNSTTVYSWLNGANAPSPTFAAKLEQLFPDAPPGIFTRKKEAVTLAKEPETNIVPFQVVRKANVLQFHVTADGTARLQLDVSGSLEDMTVVLRMLLDYNLLPDDK